MAGSRLMRNSALSGGGVAYTTDLYIGWPTGAGGENGRLVASSSKCIFLVVQFDGTLIQSVAAVRYSLSILDATGSAVDERDITTQMFPKPTVINKLELCLAPGSTYDVGIHANQGGVYQNK